MRAASGLLALAGVAVLAASGCGSGAASPGAPSRPAPAGSAANKRPLATTSTTTVRVSDAAQDRPIPDGFMGISMGFREVTAYGGTNPKSPDPVLEQLLKNLSPGQPLAVRIGGDGTDWSWWPAPHLRRPPGAHFIIDRTWVGVARALAQAVGMRLIVGINLEANSKAVAAAEAQALLHGIGRRSIQALEIGNEPELYGSFPWYKTSAGVHVLGRPSTYDFSDFLGDFGRIAGVVHGVPLAGPATGDPKWMAELGQFLSDEPRVRVATIHRYPFIRCRTTGHISIGQLLANSASQGLANGVAGYVRVVHAHHVLLRIDKLNGISCGGERGVSDTFTSALWALQTLFEMARVGVDGVNFHTVRDAINELFGLTESGGRWRATVRPEYYALMMFAQSVPPGSRLLRVAGGSHGQLHVWAVRTPGGAVRVIVINESTRGASLVRVGVPAGAWGPATVERLRAPSVGARTGVTLGGQSFGSSTTTGLLTGTPDRATVNPSGGRYVVRMPPASAAVLTAAHR